MVRCVYDVDNVKFMRVCELVCETPSAPGTAGDECTESETEEKQDWTDVEKIHRWQSQECEYITTNCHYLRSQPHIHTLCTPHIYINDQSPILMVLLFYTWV